MVGTLAVTGDAEADRLLNTDPLALIIAMLLDQQIAIELAFIGPSRLAGRMAGELDVGKIAGMDPDEFAELVRTKPALHRFPASMAGRIQAMCRHIIDEYDGDTAAIWRRVRDARTLQARLEAIPGFGPEKVKIFTAVLAKRFARRPRGWQEVAGVFADDELRSVADLDSPDSLAALRDKRRARKATGASTRD